MKSGFIVSIIIYTLTISCETHIDHTIHLNSGELFSYDLNVSGDEEGAKITKQANHYSRSEIIRDSSTGWSAIYYYESIVGFTGSDYVTIETCTGGEGIHCDKISTIEFEFRIQE